MKDVLAKRWFLLLLLAGLISVCLCPEWLKPVTVRLDLRIAVAASLFLMAWSLESGRMLHALTRPLPAVWALFLSYSAVPALAWSTGRLLPADDLRLGLLIIASVPCTLASAVIWTRLAGGNEATAMLTVLLTTATSWLLTPAWLSFAAGTSVVLDVPGMMRSLVVVLIVPVGLGQLTRLVGPLARTATRYKVVIGVVSRLLIFIIILKAAVDVSDRLRERSAPLDLGWIAAAGILCLAIHGAVLAGGFWSSRLLKMDHPAQIAIAFACSQKTLPVSLYLFDAYFQSAYPLAVLPMVFYHVGQLVVDTFVADGLARHRKFRGGSQNGAALRTTAKR